MPARSSRLGTILPLCLALASLAACKAGPFADMANPKTFDGPGLTFSYPGNWVVEASGDLEPQAGIQVRSVSVRGPASAAILIHDFSQAVPMNASQACDSLMGSVHEEAAALGATVKPGARSDVERALLGEARTGARQGYSVTVDGETKEAAAEAWVLSISDTRTVVVGVSAETQDRVRGKDGFELVLGSLATR
jgi:hypothetical protein